MSQSKSNLGSLTVPSLRYVIETCEVPTDEGVTEVGKLVFTGESDRSVEDILNSAGSSEPGGAEQLSGAAAWLVDYLVSKGGEAAVADIVKAARGEAIAERTLYRACGKARVVKSLAGFPARAIWSINVGNAPSPVEIDNPVLPVLPRPAGMAEQAELAELAPESHALSLLTATGTGVTL
jgi:hypothetical protein